MKPYTPQSVQFIKSAFSPGDLIRDGLPQIAFAGRSNVGKSSLINAMLGRKGLARTSKTPGRTREVNYFLVNETFYFVDLPGYGYAKVPRPVSAAWRALIESYIHDNPALRVMIAILDARHTPTELDLTLIEWLEEANVPYLPILTKRDKLSKNQFATQERKTRAKLGLEEPLAEFSSLTGHGREPLWKMIWEMVKSKVRS